MSNKDSSMSKAAVLAAGIAAIAQVADASKFSVFARNDSTFASSSETDTTSTAGPMGNETIVQNYSGSSFNNLTEAEVDYLTWKALSFFMNATEDYTSVDLKGTGSDSIKVGLNKLAVRFGASLRDKKGNRYGLGMPLGSFSGDVTQDYAGSVTEITRDGKLRPSFTAFFSTPAGLRLLTEYLSFVGHQNITGNPTSDYGRNTLSFEGRIPLPGLRKQDDIVAKVIAQFDGEKFGSDSMDTTTIGGSVAYGIPIDFKVRGHAVLPQGTRLYGGVSAANAGYTGSGNLGSGSAFDLGARVSISYSPSVNAQAAASQAGGRNPRNK